MKKNNNYRHKYFYKKNKKKNNISIENEILENRKNYIQEDIEIIKTNTNNKKSFSKRLKNLKIKYRKDPKKFVVMASSIFLALCLIIGTSFAALSYLSKTGNTTKIEVGTLALEIKNESNSITLDRVVPQEDKEAIENNKIHEFSVENTGTLPAHFTITLDNTCDLTKTYQIDNEEISPDKCIPNEYIKIGLSENDGEYKVLEYNPDNNNYILETGLLSSQEIKDYKMKIWLDYNTPNDYNSEGIYNIIYSGKIGINYEQVNIDTAGNTYTIVYNANGGSGEMPSTLFTIDEEKALSQNTFTKEGYFFLGWDNNINGATVVYEDQEVVKSLTDEDNKIINLYAVWGEPGTYQVRYNPNGGDIKKYTTSEEYPWVKEDGVYKSGNVDAHDTESTITSDEFTLTETTTISFDWAASSESKYSDYLYYTIYKDGEALTGTGEDTRIGGNSSITDESELTYETVTKELEPGTYKIEFTYVKDYSYTEGLDRGYVKNISYFGKETMENSIHTIGEVSALSQNEYKKEGHNFLGWSYAENGKIQFTEAAQIKNLTSKKDKIVDLYAVWTKKEYEVNVIVQNGTLNDDSLKIVKYQENGEFQIIPNEENLIGVVTCTNGQTGLYKNKVLTISSVTDSTTCTVNLVSEVTTLYEDGTLAINEDYNARNTNIETHGNVFKTYEPLSATQSYVFSSYEEQLWTNEYSDITKVEISTTISTTSTANWFSYLENLSEGDFTNLDTSQTTDMSYMFNNAGSNSYQFELTGLSSWNVSNVTNMSSLFENVGFSSGGEMSVLNVTSTFQTIESVFDIGDLSSWNTSNVINMSNMFRNAGTMNTNFDLIGLSSWDVSNVENMSYMFSNICSTSQNVIGDLSSWNVSKVENMSGMFEYAPVQINTLETWETTNATNMSSLFSGAKFITDDVNVDLTSWDTSNVSDMSYMFEYANAESQDLNLNISGWNVEKITNIERIFGSSFMSAEDLIIDMSNWNLKSFTESQGYYFNGSGCGAKNYSLNVTNMKIDNITDLSGFFYGVGGDVGYGDEPSEASGEKFEIIGLNTWDVSNITNMGLMFGSSGKEFNEWSIGDLSSWDVSKVENMNSMFEYSGQKASIVDIDFISNWDTTSVTDITSMFRCFGQNVPTLNLDLSTLNTTGITELGYVFYYAGANSDEVRINVSSWDTSGVTRMNYMFFNTGYNADTFTVTGLNTWDTSNLVNMSYMFAYAGQNATTWSIGDLTSWNFDKVTRMNYLFHNTGINATDFTSVGTITLVGGCNVSNLASESPHFKGNFNINSTLSNYSTMLTNAATGTNALINLLYKDTTGESYVDYLIEYFGPSGTVSQGNVYKVES